MTTKLTRRDSLKWIGGSLTALAGLCVLPKTEKSVVVDATPLIEANAHQDGIIYSGYLHNHPIADHPDDQNAVIRWTGGRR